MLLHKRGGIKIRLNKISPSSLLVKSGEEALQMIRVSDFDLVIMGMPGLDGFEAARLVCEVMSGS
ncbi:MAG: CheY-like chemotaxis protein [Pseudohongiellaceae bacterium]